MPPADDALPRAEVSRAARASTCCVGSPLPEEQPDALPAPSTPSVGDQAAERQDKEEREEQDVPAAGDKDYSGEHESPQRKAHRAVSARRYTARGYLPWPARG